MMNFTLRLSITIYITLILSIGVAIMLGQQNSVSPVLLVTTVPEEVRMRELILLDLPTGVRYRLLRQFTIENFAINPLDQSFVIQQRSDLALASISIAPLQNLIMKHNGEDGLGNPEWSPDGQFIAYSGHDFRQEGIYISDAQGQNLRAITETNPFAYRLLWSPDTQRIFYIEHDEQTYHLHELHIESGEDEILFSSEEFIFLVGWQADKLAFLQEGRLVQYDLYSAQTMTQQAINNLDILDSRWSQSGQALLLAYADKLSILDADAENLYHITFSDRRIISVDWWQR